MKLSPHERVLTGRWVDVDGELRPDATCERIEQLVRGHLIEVAVSPQWGTWETLFRDPDDGRYWERVYPQGHLHGGGPPQLQVIEQAEAMRKYGLGTE